VKKTVYFVQAGNLYGQNAHLPYAAGCVAANAFSMPEIRHHYQLGEFIFLRTPIEEVLAKLDEPYLVAFSCYIWNMEYHKALARAIKVRWPDCYILFGGHQVNNDNADQLHELPCADFLIHRAGEEAFAALLLALLNGQDLATVPSLSYRDAQGKTLRTTPAPCTRCDFPSPYLEGLFDSLFEQYPQLLFSMTLETNRGCPYRCAFCDWGTAWDGGLLQKPMERVKAEIDWAARHRIELLFCADGNFGILTRDEEFIDYLIAHNAKTGYPKKFYACFAKNSNETVFRLNQKLHQHGLSNGATLSFQTLSAQALTNINRENMGLTQFRQLVAQYNQADVPFYSELIIGMPGETLHSFAQGIGQLLAAGMHGALEIFPCEILPNTLLSSPDYQQKHGVKTIRVRQVQRHGNPKNNDSIPEYSNIVCQTNTMSLDDWIQAYLFSTVVQGFHSFGLLSHIAQRVHSEQKGTYEQFYSDLIAQARKNSSSLIGEQIAFLQTCYQRLAQGHGESLVCYDSRFGEITWPLGSMLFLRCAYETERFYAELPAFLTQYDLDASILAQQQLLLCLPEDGNWVDFARINVWYNRRRGALSKKAGGSA